MFKSKVVQTVLASSRMSRLKVFIPPGVFLTAGMMLGLGLAFLIAKEAWLLALALAAIVPAIIILSQYPLVAVMLWLLFMPFLPFATVGPRVFWVLHRALIPLAWAGVILSRMLRTKPHKPVQWNVAEWSMVAFLAVGAVSMGRAL